MMLRLAGSVALLMLLIPARGISADWLTYGHDPQRTGWAFEETTLTPENVPNLGLKWKSKLKNESYRLSALTAPVVAGGISTSRGVRNVVYVAGITGTVFALDAETGEELWNHAFKLVVLPGKGGYQGTFLCPNGITATPVIDKSTSMLYVIAGDGALYGLDLGSGRVRYGPVQFVAAFSKNWSLNLVDGIIYTVLAQGCGGGLSGFYSVDIRDRHHPILRQMLLSNTNTAGMWGRGGAIIGKNGRVYGSTADGMFDPIAGDYSDTVVAATLPDLNLADYYLPPNWLDLKQKDFDLGSASPVYFGWRNRNLIASGAKEAVVYVLDADALGGSDHQTTLYTSPRLGNDRSVCCEGHGIWGGMSTARDREGQTWLFVPVGGPPAVNGPKVPDHEWRQSARQHYGFQGGGRRENPKSDARAGVDFRRFRPAGSGGDRQWRRFCPFDWRKRGAEGRGKQSAPQHASRGSKSFGCPDGQGAVQQRDGHDFLGAFQRSGGGGWACFCGGS